VAYLAARPEPLTVTIAGKAAGEAAQQPTQPGSRRVSVGTVPDFAYGGTGVRIGSVVPDSPAAAAGLQAGDVLTAIDGEAVANLQAYSDLLKTLEPGQTATLTIERDGAELAVDVLLADR
jgi:aminopeptidase N